MPASNYINTKEEYRRQAAQTMLSNCELVAGDFVKVVRKVEFGEFGSTIPWNESMDKMIGCRFTIHGFNSDSVILIDNGVLRSFPLFALQKVEPPFVPVVIPLNNDYTATIYQDGSIRVGCQTFKPMEIINLHTELQKVLNKKK